MQHRYNVGNQNKSIDWFLYDRDIWRRSGAFIVDFEHLPLLFLMFLLLTLNK